MNEQLPVPEQITDMETFRKVVRQEMGNNEHANRLNFDELNEVDMTLYELYRNDMLTGEKLTAETQEAHTFGEHSSALFRGWLANQLAIRGLLRERAKPNIP